MSFCVKIANISTNWPKKYIDIYEVYLIDFLGKYGSMRKVKYENLKLKAIANITMVSA